MRTIKQLAPALVAVALLHLSACSRSEVQRSSESATSATAPSVSSSSGSVTSGSQDVPGAASEVARRAEALALVPASAGSAVVMDLIGAKTRWGLGSVTSETGPDSPDAKRFYTQVDAWGMTPELSQSRSRFAQGELSDLDVDVEISFLVKQSAVRIDRMRSTLDLEKVMASLEADGMVRSGTPDAPRFTYPEMRSGEFYSAFPSGVTVYPDRHLLVAARAGLWSTPVDGSSLADAGSVPDLVEDLGPTVWFAVTTGADACIAPDVGPAMIESEETVRKYLATLDAAGQRHAVTGTLVAVTAQDGGSIRSTYADASAAATDRPVRTKILQTLDSQVARHPYSRLLTATVTANGSTLDYDVRSRSTTLMTMVESRDLPWAFC